MVRFAMAAVIAALLCPATGKAAAECEGSTQADLNACAGAEYERSDAAMNAAYRTVMRTLAPDAQQTLKAAQRAWLSFRDRTCDLESSAVDGGSAQSMVRAGCLSKVTDRRTKTLNGYLDCEEGDLSCLGGSAE